MIAALAAIAVAGCGPREGPPARARAARGALAATTEWPFYRGDVLGQSFVDVALGADQARGLTIAWTASAPASDANPVVAGGTLYLTSADGTLQALDAATGARRWSRPIGLTPVGACNAFVGRPVGAPAVAGAAVFVPGGDATVYAFAKDGGQPLWSTRVGDPTREDFLWASAFPLHGRIYVGVATLSENVCGPVPGRVVALDQATGALVGTWWVDAQQRPGGGVWTQPVYDAATNRLFFTTGQGGFTLPLSSQPYAQAFVAIDADTLAVVDALQPVSAPFASDYDFGASPTLLDLPDGRGLVVAANKDGFVYAADRNHLAGGVVWSRQVSVAGDSPDFGTSTIVGAAYAHGTLFVGGGKTPDGFAGIVAALDPATGVPRWVFHPDGFVLASLLAVGDVLVAEATHLPDGTGRLYVLDQVTGAPVFQFSTPGGLFAQPTFAEGMLFVNDDSGVQYAFAPAAGLPPPPPPPPPPGGGIDYSAGFSATGLQLNGSAALSGTRLRLTSTTRQAGSAFYGTPVSVSAFTTDFAFQLTSPSADGFTFTLQGAGPTALGPPGGGLGYGPDLPGGAPGIAASVAVKFDLYDNAGEGVDSTGLYLNGASPTVPAIGLAASGVDLHGGHVLAVHATYDGATLAVTITDTSTGAAATERFAVDIPAAVGATTAYAGFTGGTGGLSAVQEILSWTYAASTASPPPPPPPPPPPSTGTVLFSDAFDRTQAGLGPSWTVRGAYASDGNAVSAGVDVPDRATATAAPPCADCSAEALVQRNGAREAGVFVRGAVATSDRYDAVLRDDGRLQLRRLNAGVPTVLAELPGAVPLPGTFALVSLAAVGAGPVALTASLNGSPVLAATDASAARVVGPGLCGLWTYTAGVRFDAFRISSAGP